MWRKKRYKYYVKFSFNTPEGKRHGWGTYELNFRLNSDDNIKKLIDYIAEKGDQGILASHYILDTISSVQ